MPQTQFLAYGHYSGAVEERRGRRGDRHGLCERCASEWRIIKSQHRHAPRAAWPLGKDEQEQTRLNERRSFSRYGRPTRHLLSSASLWRTLWTRSISENSSSARARARGSGTDGSSARNLVSRRARRNLNARCANVSDEITTSGPSVACTRAFLAGV